MFIISRFLVQYFWILGKLCTENGNGEYDGWYIMNDMIYCYGILNTDF